MALRLGANMVCSNLLGRTPHGPSGAKPALQVPDNASDATPQVPVWKYVASETFVRRDLSLRPGVPSALMPGSYAREMSRKAFFLGTKRARRWLLTL